MDFLPQLNFDKSQYISEIECDICSKKVNDYYYTKRQSVITCKDCLPSIFDTFKLITEQPRGYFRECCEECDCKIEHGISSYRSDIFHRNYCLDCWNKTIPVKHSNEDMILIDAGDLRGYIILDATIPKLSAFHVPEMIQSEITHERNECFTEFNDLVECDIESPILYWTFISDFIQHEDDEVAFAMNCKAGSGHPVASVFIDSHGRTRIKFSYSSVEEYIQLKNN